LWWLVLTGPLPMLVLLVLMRLLSLLSLLILVVVMTLMALPTVPWLVVLSLKNVLGNSMPATHVCMAYPLMLGILMMGMLSGALGNKRPVVPIIVDTAPLGLSRDVVA
jgi:hypothetical protein